MRNGRLVKFAAALAGAALAMLAGQSAQAGIGTERPAGRAEGQNACSNSTHAMRQLAMIDHTSDGGFQCLGVSVEGDTVQAIRLERHSFSPDTGIEQIKVVEYPTTTVDSRRGAVIDGVPGHDAIVLRGHFSNLSGTGKLEISYLFNGITGEFRTCQMVLGRTANAGWRLVNRLDQPISLIGVRIREVPVIGVVGIANLEGACS
jgi:hypothetical protein